MVVAEFASNEWRQTAPTRTKSHRGDAHRSSAHLKSTSTPDHLRPEQSDIRAERRNEGDFASSRKNFSRDPIGRNLTLSGD